MFKIGVNIGMTGNSQQFLGVLLRDMMKLDAAATMLNKKFAALKGAAIGLTAAFAGFKGLEFLSHMIKEASVLNEQIVRTKMLGGEIGSTTDQQKRNDFAMTRQVPQFDAADFQKMTKELSTQTMDSRTAQLMVPLASKIATSTAFYTGEDPENIVKNLVKVVELRGKIFSQGPDGKEHFDQAKALQELDSAGRALILGGNYLKSNDLVQLAKQGGAAIKLQTAESFYAAGIEMAISMGGARTGTAETSLVQQFIGGVMAKRTAVALEQSGLLKPGEWTSKGGGGGVTLKPAAMNRFKAIGNDPIAWIEGPGRAALEKYAKQNGIDIMQAVFRLFGRATTQRFASEALSNQPQFERAREMTKNIPHMQEIYDLLQRESYDQNVLAFTKTWSTLIQALGDPLIPGAITVMHQAIGVMQEMVRVAAANPEAVKFYGEIFAWVSSLALVGGSIKVLGFALKAVGAGLESLLHAIIGNTLADGILAVVKALAKFSGIIFFFQTLLSSSKTNEKPGDLEKYGGQSHPGTPSGPRVSKTPNERMHDFGANIQEGLHDYGKKLMEYHPETPFMPMAYHRSAADRTTLLQDIAYRRGLDDASVGSPASIWPRGRGAQGQASPVLVEIVGGHSETTVRNGRHIADGVMTHITRAIDKPSAGSTGADGRISAWPTLAGA